jgi:carbon storage regulator
MLVVSRRRDETVVVTLPDGNRIVFSVVDIRGDKVRLGIEAPKSIPVHRGEIQEAIDREHSK